VTQELVDIVDTIISQRISGLEISIKASISETSNKLKTDIHSLTAVFGSSMDSMTDIFKAHMEEFKSERLRLFEEVNLVRDKQNTVEMEVAALTHQVESLVKLLGEYETKESVKQAIQIVQDSLNNKLETIDKFQEIISELKKEKDENDILWKSAFVLVMKTLEYVSKTVNNYTSTIAYIPGSNTIKSYSQYISSFIL
jgi:anion-transporting  ArsA/GET3 family ATPase